MGKSPTYEDYQGWSNPPFPIINQRPHDHCSWIWTWTHDRCPSSGENPSVPSISKLEDPLFRYTLAFPKTQHITWCRFVHVHIYKPTVYIYIYIHWYTNTYRSYNIRVYLSIYLSFYLYAYIYICAYIYIHIYTCINKNRCVCINICLYTIKNTYTKWAFFSIQIT